MKPAPILVGCFLLLAILPAAAQASSGDAPRQLPAGQLLDSVTCLSDPAQGYALYLPSAYTAGKAWPIIYAFDPLANGKVAVKLYKDAAEKYGYIVAGSNNSRNFAADEVSKAAQTLWQDTHSRLALDPHRIYMTGFSGGARVATTLAVRCAPCEIAGVISHGAGYPSSFPPSEKDRFAYFAFVGDQDFNWAEVMELRRKKEEMNAPYRLRVFSGSHQWAPPELVEEAIEWMELKAMQAGTKPRDAAFIDRLFSRAQNDAEHAGQLHDAITGFEAFRALAADFNGLKDVTQYQQKLAALKASPELKQALKKEDEQIAGQRSTTQELAGKIAQLGDADFEEKTDLQTAIVDGMKGLQAKAKGSKSEDQRLVLLRSFNDLWAQTVEAGQAQLENKHFVKAEYYFQLLRTVTPEEPWPALLLAETQAAKGDKKHAIKDLREAIKCGLKNPDAIEKDRNLQTLQSEAEFQQMIAELKARKQSP